MEIQEPISRRDFATLHFDPTLPGMLGSTLIGDQVVQVGESSQKRLLTAAWMMQRFHHEQFALEGVVGLIQQGAGHRHLRVYEHRGFCRKSCSERGMKGQLLLSVRR